MRRSRKATPATRGWDVRVTPAQKESWDGYYDEKYKPKGIEGKIAVRLTLNGEDRMTFKLLAVDDPDFEDQITTARAEALEKAAALDAVGAA